MTQLRDWMLEELERRNYAPGTARAYLFAVKQFAEHFHRAPDQLGAEHIREYRLSLFGGGMWAGKTGPNGVPPRVSCSFRRPGGIRVLTRCRPPRCAGDHPG